MTTAVVIGVGPGLGMSIAHRFGTAGYRIALVSRSDTRHAGYVASLADAGVHADAFVADVRDTNRLVATLDTIAERDTVDVVYYGPGAADPTQPPEPITDTDADAVRQAMSWFYPAVDVVGRVLPGMIERGGGGLLFAGGLSAVRPMPALGALAISSAALRNYALTLHAALAGRGVYAGTVTIGGLVERGDIHRFVAARHGAVPTLDPDDIADTAWELFATRTRAEAVVSGPGLS